jgi:fumarate reductase flavoprotein subunit
VKTLVDIIHKTGNKTMTETAGKKLITDSKGNVVGIIAEDTDSGDEIEFHTKGGVILCTGGFANNLKMMKKYIANAEQLVAGPKAGREGDGINMALAVGAGTESMGSLLVLGGIPIGEDPNKTLTDTTPLGQTTSVLRQPLLWVSKAGDRFFNEQHSSDWTVSQNAIERVGKRYFVVMDQNTVDELKTKGTFMPYSDWVPAGTKLNLIDQGIKEGEKKGYAFKANTIDALAQKMGVPAGNLKKTVADINRYTEYNYDEVFGKDRRFLRKVEQGPFYAVEGEPSFMSTIGGVRINANMQAVTDQDKPINGLYAAGIDAGGMFGDTYDLIMPGSLSSYAATGGRIAAEHIAVKLGKIKK